MAADDRERWLSMMVTTHAVVGVAVTSPLLVLAPELAPVAVAVPYTLFRKRLPPYFERIM